MKVWSHTVKGRKPVNEDYLLYQDLGDGRYICLIADGMGGYAKGDVAAKLVAENMLALLSSQKQVDQSLIQIGINKANLALRQMRTRTCEKSGATLGGVYIEGNKAICFWVGDVKILHFRNNELVFESKPHSLTTELQERGIVMDAGAIASHRHIVTRSIQGDDSNPIADFYETSQLSHDDSFLLCSDGFPLQQIYSASFMENMLISIQTHGITANASDDSSVAFIAV